MNTLGIGGVPSIQPTQTEINIHEENMNHLMEKVLERENLKRAFERIKRNKGAPGIDGMKVEELQEFLKINWKAIREALMNGTYKPSPVRRFEIPKPDGGVRELGIPTVLDRFLQQAIQQVLTPIFEPTFSNSSYGFRPKRSARQAVTQAQQKIQQGKSWVVDIDIEKFFDRVNHDILMGKLFKQIKDRRILQLIRRYLESGVMINGCCVATEEGTPQGGPLSPLLANIMLNDLDKELERRGHAFVRYADDCNIYVKSKRAGERVYRSVKRFIEDKLKLKINEAKSAVARPWKRKFLGFSVTSQKQTKLRLAPRTIEKFKEKVKEITRGLISTSIGKRIEKLNEYIKGWIGYYYVAEAKEILDDLDKWIRRRLRMCLLKQWKRCKTKLRNMISRGLEESWAANIAYSRKKYWRLSKTAQMNKALDNAYWQEQGLENLVERYCNLRKAL